MPSLLRASLGDKVRKDVRAIINRQMQSPDATARVRRHLNKRIAEMQARGEPLIYRMFVNSVETDDLSTISFKDGKIEIVFPRLNGAVLAIIAYAKTISPVVSGFYAEAWFAMVDGQPWLDLYKPIPHDATVYVTNFAPYARRLEEQGRTGRSGRLSSHRRPENVITERTRAFAKKFKSVVVERTYVPIPGGGLARGVQVPYILKTGRHRGEPILYPALRITER